MDPQFLYPHEGFSTSPCKYLNPGHIGDVIRRQAACFLGLISIHNHLLCQEENYLSGCPVSSAKVTEKI